MIFLIPAWKRPAQPDLKVSALDIQKYITQDGELLERIKSEYESGVKEWEEQDKTALTAQGVGVASQLKLTNDIVRNSDIAQKGDGSEELVYDAELNNVQYLLEVAMQTAVKGQGVNVRPLFCKRFIHQPGFAWLNCYNKERIT